MDLRFAGAEADLAALMEAGLIREDELQLLIAELMGQEREWMREIMRLRADKWMASGWSSGIDAPAEPLVDYF